MKIIGAILIGLTVSYGHTAHNCREFLRVSTTKGASQGLRALFTVVAHGSSGVEACKKKQTLQALQALWMHDVEPLDLDDQEKNKKTLSCLLSDFKDDRDFLKIVADKEKRLQEAFFHRRAFASEEIQKFRDECAQCPAHFRKIAALGLNQQKARVLELNEKQWQRKFESFTTHYSFSQAYADDVEREKLFSKILVLEPEFKKELQDSDIFFSHYYKVAKKEAFPSVDEQQVLANTYAAQVRKKKKQLRDLSNTIFKSVIAMKLLIMASVCYFD